MPPTAFGQAGGASSAMCVRTDGVGVTWNVEPLGALQSDLDQTGESLSGEVFAHGPDNDATPRAVERLRVTEYPRS